MDHIVFSLKQSLAIEDKIFETVFEVDIDTYLKRETTISLMSSLWDSLYAQIVLNDRTPEDRNNIFNGIRSLHYLKLLLLQDVNNKPQSWNKYLKIKPTVKIDDIVFTIEDNGIVGEIDDTIKEEIIFLIVTRFLLRCA